MQSARGFEYGVVHLLSPRSGSLVDIIGSELHLKSSTVEDLLDLGAIYYEHHRVQENLLISDGDYLRIHTRPRRFPKNDYAWNDRILFQNDDFIVVNKPAALPVHASVDNLRENLLTYLSEHLSIKLYVTHRLDVPTKGLIVIAKTSKFQTEFNKELTARGVRKIYKALVLGKGPEVGLLKHYMEPSPRAPKKVSRNFHNGWQECVLEVLSKIVVKTSDQDSQTELKIELHTGRTHQIRAQLAIEGFPILGDTAYGALKFFEQEEIALDACKLSFLYEKSKMNFEI